jgi:uncharacterized protein (DUF2267 family)
MELFYEGLFSALSNNTQAEQFTPSNNNLLDYYLSLIENYNAFSKEGFRNSGSTSFDNITAYLSAEISNDGIKVNFSEYVDSFGSTLKQFINTVEQWFKDAAHVVVEYAGKTYEIAKEILIKVLNTLQDVFTIAKTKFEEAMQEGKHIMEKVGEMLSLTLDTIRQAFFTSIAYASNAIKTIFSGSKMNQESLTYNDLKAYKEIPAAYFTSKIFNEGEFNIDYIIDPKQTDDSVISKVAYAFKSHVHSKQIESINDDISSIIKQNNGIGKHHTSADIKKLVSANDKQISKYYDNLNIISRSFEIDYVIADMLKNNTYNYDEINKYYAELTKTKALLQKYSDNIKSTIGKYNSNEAQKLLTKINKVTQSIDNAIEHAKYGLEVAQMIEKQKLLAEKIFKDGFYIAVSAGLLYYAYKLYKGFKPKQELLKAAGLSATLILIVLMIKFITENAYQIYYKMKEFKQTMVTSLEGPDAIVSALFIVAIGLTLGVAAYRTKLNLSEAKQLGVRTGKMNKI